MVKTILMRLRLWQVCVLFFGVLGLWASLGLTSAASRTARAQDLSKQPNIFMIYSDDVTKRDLGCYGNKAVRTPRLEQLAREGMIFQNVFTASPQCAPSRAALYTGLYPFRNGAHPNWSEVKPGTKSMAHYYGRSRVQGHSPGKEARQP